MLAVGFHSVADDADRAEIDSEAHGVVCEAFRSAVASVANPRAKFDAALEAYMARYPHIAKEIARHAVAYILATDGM
jgi:hypothetical protein